MLGFSITQTKKFQMSKLDLEKEEELEIEFNICWIIEKAMEFQKNIYLCFIDYAKAFDCVIINCGKLFQEMGITDHLTCLLRNMYVGQEATVRTPMEHRTTDWFKIEKGVPQG